MLGNGLIYNHCILLSGLLILQINAVCRNQRCYEVLLQIYESCEFNAFEEGKCSIPALSAETQCWDVIRLASSRLDHVIVVNQKVGQFKRGH